MTPRMLVTLAFSLLLGPLAAPAAHAGAIDSLAFLAGSWSSGDAANRVEEHWTAAGGGLMLGVNRELRAGKLASFEYFRVVEKDGALTFWAQPGGREATPFPATEVSARRVVFENAAHDFPQRIAYWVEKPGELHARVEGTYQGKHESLEWTWTRSELAK